VTQQVRSEDLNPKCLAAFAGFVQVSHLDPGSNLVSQRPQKRRPRKLHFHTRVVDPRK